MTSVILLRLIVFLIHMSNFIKTNSPFVIEALMVSLCFGAIISRYLIPSM
ncbi:maker198 [Drosophila busckii]|uniref:Maker198 n=1 Tax=Drosophila busckii TaxID=30019 RepID=A0A0M4ELY3_DROBS|nr:maker198 [Drosophila busckii]